MDVVASYDNLGSLHSALCEIDQEKEYHHRALEIYLKKLGAENGHVATSYNNLSSLHIALGETDQEKEYYNRALETRLKKLGAEHVDVVRTFLLFNLGCVYNEVGEFEEAQYCLDRALVIYIS